MQGKTSNLRDFDVQAKLGEGAFGQVFKVKRKADGKQYALKKVKIGAMKEKERENALNQIRILASYNEQYIIGYKEAFYDEQSSALCVVMEFAAGGDILKQNQKHQKARTRYKEQQIWKALVHMSKGLKSLHQRKILHRDLKCANVFITVDNVYKLGDLNVSKVLKKDMAFTQTGTPYYASPEVWKDKPYNLKSDMWSLGCVLYEMAALRPPFVASDLQTLYKKVCSGMFERIPMTYSGELANVIGSLLKVDPSKRPDTDDLLSSNIVRKRYNGQYQQQNNGTEDDFDELLKTIKFNPKDLKGLKHILPKANYQEDSLDRERMKIQDLKGGVQSCKHARKEPNIKHQIKVSLDDNDRKLKQFIEKRRLLEEKQRQRQLKLLKEQKGELLKNRERVLSACGIRPPQNLYESPHPKIAVASKNDQGIQSSRNGSSKNIRKVEQKNSAPKLPPKPNGAPNLNYKLPPKPSMGSYQPPKAEQKHEVRHAQQSSRPKGGLASGRSNRSSSMQRVIYPSWWG